MKKFANNHRQSWGEERGATLVFIALLMFVFIGVAALAVDIGNMVVVRNELQNAADAGALAGAATLYYGPGNPPPVGIAEGCLNSNAVNIASASATSNQSANTAAEVNSGDVVVGNWNRTTNVFTQISFPGTCTSPGLPINAVRVTTRRQATPVATFFAGIWEGMGSFTSQASATAWIDSPGPPIAAGEFDQPIVICQESLTNGCNIGRMINSGRDNNDKPVDNNTGGWTDFNQNNPCSGGTNANTVKNTICSGGNPLPVNPGEVATNGGEIESAFKELRKCWDNATNKTKPWLLKLPVVRCPSPNIGTCEVVVGAVQVEVVWITENGKDPLYKEVPKQMGDWSSATTDGQTRWNEFVNYYQLQNSDGTPAPYQKSAIYFKPTCEFTQIAGRTGGFGFNVIARSPVLVQ